MKKNNLQIYITIVFSLITLVLGFSITYFKTKALSSEEIGVIALFSSIASIINIIGLFGSTQSIIKYIPSFEDSNRKKTAFIILMVAIVSAVLSFLLIILFLFKTNISIFYNNRLFIQYFNGIFLIIIFSTFSLLIDSIYKVYGRPVLSQLITSIIKSFLNILILIFVISFKQSFYMYYVLYIGLLGTMFVVQILMLFRFKMFAKPDFSFLNNKFVKKMFVFNTFMLFSGISHLLNYQLDSLMIGRMLTASDVGVYSIVIVLGNLVGLAAQGLTRVTHPRISKHIQNNDLQNLEKEYKSTGDFQFLIGLTVFLGLVMYSKTFLLLFGEVYSKAYIVTIIIGFGYLIDSVTSFCGGIIGYSRLFKYDILLEVLLLIGNVTLNLVLIPHFGIIGAAIATSITLIVYNLLKVIIVKLNYNIHPFSMNNLKVVIGIGFSAIISSTINKLITIPNIFFEFMIKTLLFLFICVVVLHIQKYDNQLLKFKRRT